MNVNSTEIVKKLYIATALEKFSFNGIAAILVLYSVTALGLSDQNAFEIFGLVNSFAFISALIGGWLSDSFLGYQKTLILGSILMIIGLISTYFIAKLTPSMYFMLAIIALGSGLIRGNIPSFLGAVCNENGLNRDATFSTFYVAINIGTILGAGVCGVVGQMFSWRVAFLLAGIAMLFFFIMLVKPSNNSLGNKILDIQGNYKIKSRLPLVSLILFSTIVVFFMLLFFKNISNVIYILIFLMSVIIFIIATIKSQSFKPMITIFILMIFNTVFFALYSQESMSIIMFAERNVERSLNSVFGISHISLFNRHINEIPASFFQTIDPFWNILLGTAFVFLWNFNFLKNSYNGKFFAGAVMISCAFCLILTGIKYATHDKVSLWWLVFSYLFFVLGELLIIPTGLSAVSELAPKKISGLVMGIWYFFMGLSMWIAELFSKISSIQRSNDTVASSVIVYYDAFKNYLFWSIGLCVYILVLILVQNRKIFITYFYRETDA